MARHNNIRGGVADLSGKAFNPYHVRDEPLIYSSHTVKRTNATPDGAGGNKDHTVAPPPEVTEKKGNLLICDLWQKRTDSVHDMRVVNNGPVAQDK